MLLSCACAQRDSGVSHTPVHDPSLQLGARHVTAYFPLYTSILEPKHLSHYILQPNQPRPRRIFKTKIINKNWGSGDMGMQRVSAFHMEGKVHRGIQFFTSWEDLY